MSKSIFEALFFGKISIWEREVTVSPERREIEKKIESEKRYFIEKMSLDDCQRFQALENLYIQASEDEEIGIFSHGFTMGALIMLEIYAGRDEIINE